MSQLASAMIAVWLRDKRRTTSFYPLLHTHMPDIFPNVIAMFAAMFPRSLDVSRVYKKSLYFGAGIGLAKYLFLLIVLMPPAA